MQVIRRVFRTLAGMQDDEPMGPWQVALYGILALTAFVLVLTWVTGATPTCVAGGVCGR